MKEVCENRGTEEHEVKDADTIEKDDLNKKEINRRCPVEGHGGEYDGIRGDSNWYPDPESIPGDRHGTNVEKKSWGEIMDEYEFEKIPFHDGEPDFSEVSKGEVKIDEFSDDRDKNFTLADEKLAELRGCEPEEVEDWRTEHKYTWHEVSDCATMQKVPREVHGNIPHDGGISEKKAENQSAVQ